MLTIGQLSYCNAFPLFGGWDFGQQPRPGTFIKNAPSYLNKAMSDGTLDVALMSSIEVLKQKEKLEQVASYGIAASGAVQSVCLYSSCPLEDLDRATIAVTDESATSIALLQCLCFHLWKISPRLLTAKQPEAVEAKAYLLIGDKALCHTPQPGIETIDLAHAWHAWTGKPFVFALFAKQKNSLKHQELDAFCSALHHSYTWSKAHFPQILKAAKAHTKRCNDSLEKYYNCLSYALTDEYLQGLQLFWELSANVR